MLLRRISNTIALQFTAFVFGLLLINGALFLVADYGNARRMAAGRLERSAQFLADRIAIDLDHLPIGLPPMMRERVRVVDPMGRPLHTGDFFVGIPFTRSGGTFEVVVDDDRYTILTSPIVTAGELRGFLQVADVDRLQTHDLTERALLYLFVSVVISALTFAVGRFFARTSLAPAEEAMARLEQFTQDASHELRTPLAALNSSLDLALKTGKLQEGIHSAKEDVREVSILVERLLELARLDGFALSSEEVDLPHIVEEQVSRMREAAAKKQIAIETFIDPDVTVRGDAALIRQVFTNLLANAIKFSKPEGGTIRVRLMKSALSVEDSGIGIGASDLPHIFDRFYQAEPSRSRGGSGLGLALAKRIVELHGWTISARSAPGSGTTFTVKF